MTPAETPLGLARAAAPARKGIATSEFRYAVVPTMVVGAALVYLGWRSGDQEMLCEGVTLLKVVAVGYAGARGLTKGLQSLGRKQQP